MSVAKSSSVRRVVVLSRDAAFAELQDRRFDTNGRVLRVPSGYEAAAEILAEPTAALVIDLRALSGRHLRLLEVARAAGVEMLLVGPIPSGADSDAFGGARLVARSDLPAAIRRIAGKPLPASGQPTEAKDTDPRAPSETEAPTAVKLTPAKSPTKGSVETAAGDQQGGAGVFQQDEALLTAEELSRPAGG